MAKKIKGGLPAGILLGAWAMCTAALYQGLVIRRYILRTFKWQRGRSVRFVVVSDLHSLTFGEHQQEILEPIRSQRPDYILLPGDIVDKRRPSEASRQFLRGAADIAPTFFATGNHEYYTYRTPEIKKMIRKCGVTVLSDRFVELVSPGGDLILAGCEDPYRQQLHPGYNPAEAMETAFSSLAKSSAYTVLLAHRPELGQLYRQAHFDLAVSGHAHGGQARIPGLINGIYSPHQGLLPVYAGGCYQNGRLTHVVSRGVAVYPEVPRVCNPPEIVVIDLLGIKKSQKNQ